MAVITPEPEILLPGEFELWVVFEGAAIVGIHLDYAEAVRFIDVNPERRLILQKYLSRPLSDSFKIDKVFVVEVRVP